MRQILETEFDARFFRLGQAAIKSFLKYNPGWEVHVCDLGLTEEQHEELAAVASVEHGTVWEPGRWPHSTARMECLARLCRLPDTTILHLDADTLTFGSVAPLIAGLQRAKTPIAMTPSRLSMRDSLFSLDRLKSVYETPEVWLPHCCYSFGVVAMTASEQLACVYERANEKYREHSGIFRGVDQTAVVAELLDADIAIASMSKLHNFYPAGADRSDIALFNPPLLADGTKLVTLHISVPKGLVFPADAPLYSIGWWWRKWLDHYEGEPWPKTA